MLCEHGLHLESDYPRWIVDAWERILDKHFRDLKDFENVLVSRKLWFDDLPALMRVRVTTPNVLVALRKRDPGSSKPYNFALSPILMDPVPKCTLKSAPQTEVFQQPRLITTVSEP